MSWSFGLLRQLPVPRRTRTRWDRSAPTQAPRAASPFPLFSDPIPKQCKFPSASYQGTFFGSLNFSPNSGFKTTPRGTRPSLFQPEQGARFLGALWARPAPGPGRRKQLCTQSLAASGEKEHSQLSVRGAHSFRGDSHSHQI